MDSISIYVLVFLLFIAVDIVLLGAIYKRGFNNKNVHRMKDNIKKIRETGKLLFKARCGGIIGSFRFQKGFMNVQVYDTGIVLSPILFPELCINKSEITRVTTDASLLSNKSTIEHKSDSLNKNIVVYCDISKYFN